MKTAIKLNQKQLVVLGIIAKYRFVTVGQMQQYLGLSSRTSTNKKLEVLVEAGYLDKRYDKSYVKRSRPATYFVTPQTFKRLRGLNEAKYVTDALVRISYNDKRRSEQFIDDQLVVFSAAQTLERQYPGIKLYTERQLGGFEYFPRPLPNLYAVHGSGPDTTRYFLFHFSQYKPPFTHAKRINDLITYAESGEYDVTGNNFPAILAICDTPSIERSAQRTFRRAINQSSETPQVYTTSTSAITNPLNSNPASWTDIQDSDELVSLEDISLQLAGCWYTKY